MDDWMFDYETELSNREKYCAGIIRDRQVFDVSVLYEYP